MSASAPAPSSGKICQMCKQDCSAKPRTKDADGKYWCNECMAKRAAAKPAAASPAARPAPAARPGAGQANSAPDYLWGGASTAAKGAPCPSCKTFMKEGSELCTQCGFSVKAGRRLGTKITKEKGKLSDSAAGRAALGGASLMLWLIVGGVACVACFAGWFALAYYGNIEIGWLALLVGAIIGAAIGLTGRSNLNSISGLIAAGYTFLVVAGWKVALLMLTDVSEALGDGEIFKMLAFSALFAFLGCGVAYRLGTYGIDVK